MSKVVKFPIERTNLKQMAPGKGLADIVIFPGVRIERREFNLADRHPRQNHRQTAKALAKDI